MRHKWIETGQAVLVNVMNHLVLMAVAVCVVGVFGRKEPGLPLWAAMGLLPIGLYAVRRKIRQFFLFLAIHLLLPGIVLLLPIEELLIRCVVLGMTLIYAVWSVCIRHKGQDSDDYQLAPVFSISVMGAVTLIENLQSKNGWEPYYLAIAILYLALYFISYFISQYLFFLTVSKSSVGVIPEREIFSSGMRQTALFSLGSVCLLLLTANIGWVGYMLSWIWKGLKVLLRALFSLIPEGEEVTETEGAVQPETQQPQMPDTGDASENPLLQAIMEILEKVFIVVVCVAFVVLVVVAVVKGIQYLRNRFYQSGKEAAVELYDGQDVRESCAIDKRGKESAGWFSFLNNRERIRKIFRKQVLKHKNTIVGDRSADVLGYMTAQECCRMLPEEKDQAVVLKEIYEKARYSEQDITSDDVRRIKKMT